MNSDRSTPSADAKSIAVRSIELVAAGSREDFDAIIHPDAVNHETKTEPPHTRVRGPGSWHATALWLRGHLHHDYGIAPEQLHWVAGMDDLS